jgi:hypothetical protein
MNEFILNMDKLPVDLNNLFQLSYSFDALKIAIEYLANEQVRQNEEI